MKKVLITAQSFSTPAELLQFVNDNNIFQTNIVSITYNSFTGEFILWFADVEQKIIKALARNGHLTPSRYRRQRKNKPTM